MYLNQSKDPKIAALYQGSKFFRLKESGNGKLISQALVRDWETCQRGALPAG
jgi:hypothetical protein